MKLYDLIGAGPGYGDGPYSWSSALNKTEQQISGREGSRTAAGETITGTINNGFLGIGRSEYSVVGINVNGIANMRTAIRNYVSEIETHIGNIEAAANANNAYRSEDVQNAVSIYIEKVKSYCINLVSQLLAFSDQLEEVKAAYMAKMSNISSNINGRTTSFSEGTKYTENMQG